MGHVRTSAACSFRATYSSIRTARTWFIGIQSLGGVNGIVNTFVLGWVMDGVARFQAGTPLFFTAAVNTSNSYNAGPLAS